MLSYFYDEGSLGSYVAPTKDTIDSGSMGRLLYQAAYDNNIKEVYDLIFHGASPVWTNEFGNAPIHVACNEGHLEVVKLFVKLNNEAINFPGRGGNTPLHFAASPPKLAKEHYDTIVFLLENGADGLKKNDRNRSPFDVCSARGPFSKQTKKKLDGILLEKFSMMLVAGDEQNGTAAEISGKDEGPKIETSNRALFRSPPEKSSAAGHGNRRAADGGREAQKKGPSSSFDSIVSDELNFPLPSSIDLFNSPNLSPKHENSAKKTDDDSCEDDAQRFSETTSAILNADIFKQSTTLAVAPAAATPPGVEARHGTDNASSSSEEEDFGFGYDDYNDDDSAPEKDDGYFIQIDGQEIWVSNDGGLGDSGSDSGADDYDFGGEDDYRQELKDRIAKMETSLEARESGPVRNVPTQGQEMDSVHEHNSGTGHTLSNFENVPMDNEDDAVAANDISSDSSHVNDDSTDLEQRVIGSVANVLSENLEALKTADIKEKIDSASAVLKDTFALQRENLSKAVAATTERFNLGQGWPGMSKNQKIRHQVVDVQVSVDKHVGLGVQFNEYLQVVMFRPGEELTPLEMVGIEIGDTLETINGERVEPPLNAAMNVLKMAISKSPMVHLSFDRAHRADSHAKRKVLF
eukprot:g6563.t1